MSPSEFPELRPIEPRRVGPVSRLPPRRRLGSGLVIAGVAAASLLGVAGGFLMRPNLGDQQPARQAAVRKVEIPREPAGLGIVVIPAPEPVIPVLPPAPKTAPDEGFTPQPIQPPQAEPPPRPRAIEGVVMRPFQDAMRRPARPSFNCRHARTTSERMICVDPNLAAADRRLAKAYGEALAAGVPEQMLRRQQDVWLNAREDAARFGPEDVARVYDARIAELELMGRY